MSLAASRLGTGRDAERGLRAGVGLASTAPGWFARIGDPVEAFVGRIRSVCEAGSEISVRVSGSNRDSGRSGRFRAWREAGRDLELAVDRGLVEDRGPGYVTNVAAERGEGLNVRL